MKCSGLRSKALTLTIYRTTMVFIIDPLEQRQQFNPIGEHLSLCRAISGYIAILNRDKIPTTVHILEEAAVFSR